MSSPDRAAGDRAASDRAGMALVGKQRREHSALWWHLSRICVLTFCRVWFRLRIEGRENVPTTGPVLLVANHASYLDPPLVGITAGRYVRFLAQAGLARFAPLRWWLSAVGVTLIDRSAPSKEAMRLVTDSLRCGDAVGVFPEGTRTRDGGVAEFRSGIEFLARRGKAMVVPVGIDGAFRAMSRHAVLPRPRKIVVRYGAPWTAEQVLAEGGLAALRRRVAELARAPLESPRSQDKHSASVTPEVPGDEPPAGAT